MSKDVSSANILTRYRPIRMPNACSMSSSKTNTIRNTVYTSNSNSSIASPNTSRSPDAPPRPCRASRAATCDRRSCAFRQRAPVTILMIFVMRSSGDSRYRCMFEPMSSMPSVRTRTSATVK